MSTRTPIDATRAVGILNSRTPVSMDHAGNQVSLFIQGKGTFQSAAQQEAATPGQKQYFDKYIYNLKANSTEAMSRPEVKAIFAEAMKAETAGDTEKADELFNEYLNGVQISFNVIANAGVRRFEDGNQVTAIVGTASTKAGHTAVVVSNVKYKAPLVIESRKFTIEELMGV